MKYVMLALMVLAIGCSAEHSGSKLDKLNGLWQADVGEGILYEEWHKGADDIMYGKTYMLNGTDSMVFERVQLVQRDSGVYYIPVVKDQNNGLPVTFKMTGSGDSAFVFENKLHDFPQRITYRFVTKDSIAARIEGLKEGVSHAEDIQYSRVK